MNVSDLTSRRPMMLCCIVLYQQHIQHILNALCFGNLNHKSMRGEYF